ncbi:MAG TPA: M50 family metallopeptidase [Euzebyales bacterium]|nr:M50 family metallopeptidase [Euzebyales bacterium]
MIALLVFVVVIVGSIMIHEAGHFFTARWFGMKAERFFFGFGPTLWSVRRGDTEYGVKAIPAGGFVKITGMSRYEDIPDSDRGRAFYAKPAWQRAIVLLSGCVTHFVLAAVLLFSVMAFFELPRLEGGVPVTSNEITEVAPDSPAEAAGLRPQDRVVAIDGTPVESFEDMRGVVASRPGEAVELTYARGSETRTVRVTLGEHTVDGRQAGFIGLASNALVMERYSVGEAFTGVFRGEFSLVTQTVRSLAGIGQVFTPDSIAAWLQQADGETPRTADGPVSLIGAGQVAMTLGQVGAFSSVLLLLAQLQIVIGTLNLLPLPPFDGGHLAVLAAESVVNTVRRARGLTGDWQVDPMTLMPLTLAVLLIVGLFALTAFYVDIVNPASRLIQ